MKRFTKDSSLTLLVKKSGSFLITRIIGILLGFFLSWYVSQLGGAQTWGQFIITFSILNSIVVFSILGLDTITVKYTAQSDSNEAIQTNTISQLLMMSGIASILVAFMFYKGYQIFFASTNVKIDLEQIFVISIMIPGLTWFRVISSYYRGKEKLVIHGFIKNILIFSGMLIFIFFGSIFWHETIDVHVMLVYLTVVIYSVVLAFLAVLLIKSKVKFGYRKVKSFASIYKESLPLMLVASLALLTGYTDIFMLGYFESDQAVGVYDIAIKYSSITTLFLGAINAYVMPKFAFFYKSKEREKLIAIVKRSSFLILTLTFPMLIVLLFASSFVMKFYGTEFLFGVLSLRLLILAQLVSALCGSVAILLQMTDNQVAFQNIFLIATVINIVFNFILIPIYGITGAALATLISTSFWNIGATIYAKVKLDILTIYWPERLSI